MQVAQPRLGRLSVILVTVRCARSVLKSVRCQTILEVPDRMDEYALLPGQEQEDARKLEKCALHATSLLTSIGVRKKFKPFAEGLQLAVRRGPCTAAQRLSFIR
jgi:hypothetical protein